MCGRFTYRLTWREIYQLYRLTMPELPGRNLQARYNVCPTTTIDAVIQRDAKRELVPMRWGLVPSWWKKKAKETPATFNARAETVAEKPMFRSAFKRTRCLIPASGYYEWHTTPTGKQPFYFTARDGGALTIAGLWDEWKDIETGEPLKSCTMIITTASEFVNKFHERMPVLLQQKDFEPWLTGNAGTEILRPAAKDYLQTWPVSKRVNSSRTPDDDPTLIDSIDQDPMPTDDPEALMAWGKRTIQGE
jgi:putative SOS response-associated peptidase YedK